MTQIAVNDQAAVELQELALRDARSVEDLVAEAIQTYLSFRYYDSELSAAQTGRLQQSKAQADRGEFVSQEEVEAFFDDWEKEAAAR